MQSIRLRGCFLIFGASLLVFPLQTLSGSEWSDSDLSLLRLQWIGSLPKLPPDPTNQYADNPAAAEFGQKLFFEPRFSANGKVSCATCHMPEKFFTDGLAKARGVGETSRSAPSVIGVAYSPWFFWDGRSDSLWSQALGPLESNVEHGGNRLQYARIIHDNPVYKKTYEGMFGVMPDLSNSKRFPENASPSGSQDAIDKWNKMAKADRVAITRVFVNIGKAIAAYERLLMPGPSRFDKYVESILKGAPDSSNILSSTEVAGLKLFIGKAQCVTCHQGPLFTNHGFHNVGAPDPATQRPKYMLPIFYLFKDKPLVDNGRFTGVQKVLQSEFNCLGEYTDAGDNDCAELRFTNTKHTHTLGAFKVPTLRNVSKTAPYMHNGELETIDDVLLHYNTAPKAPSGHSELRPLNLKPAELVQLKAFLQSLSSPPKVASELLQAPDLKTGM